MEKIIKIGLDFHGVLETNTLYFADFCRAVHKKGWEVHIISGGPKNKVRKYMNCMKIPYTNIFAILDVCEEAGIVEYRNDGSFYVDDYIWDKAKGEYCLQNAIDLHIDDTLIYAKYFKTPFCWYNAAGERCNIVNTDKVIDFSKKIPDVITDIENYFNNKS